MSKLRTNSSPNLVPYGSSSDEQDYDDSALEGIAANIKLLLKLIQDHKVACDKGKNDGRRMLRVATMMTILDSVRTRIQKCQAFGNKVSGSERRRYHSDDLKLSHVPGEKRHADQIDDEKAKLRKQLSASLAARKSLEIMCSSLGKEKEIMAMELSKKVHELNEMDELINDLNVQNGTLLERVQQCSSIHRGRTYNDDKGSLQTRISSPAICGDGGETQGNGALQERNKALSEQLLRSLDGYRSMKRKLQETQEENQVLRATMEEMGRNISTSLEQIRDFKERIASGSDPPDDTQEEITKLENMIECLEIQVAKHDQIKGECVKPKGDISACQPSVVA